MNTMKNIFPDDHATLSAPVTASPAAQSWLTACELWRVFNAFSDPVMLIGADYRICMANRAMADFVGVPLDDLPGKFCYKLCHEKDAPIALCPHAKALQDHHSHSEELVELHSGKPILITVSPFYDDAGVFSGSLHFIKDMSEHYNLLAIIKESREKYRSVVDVQTDLIIRLDRNGRINFVNNSGCEFFGKSRQELLGKRGRAEIRSDEVRRIEAVVAELTRENRSATVECQLCDATGQPHVIQFACLLLESDSEPSGVQLVGRDISNLKTGSEQALRSTSARGDRRTAMEGLQGRTNYKQENHLP